MPNSVFLGPGLASGGTSIYLKPGPAYNGNSVFLTPTVGGGVAPVPTYSDIIMADGPSAYWPLQESSGPVVSLAAGAPNGVVSGGATYGAAGPWAGAKAILLDGLTGRITMPTGAYEAFGTGGATLECWIKPVVVKAVFGFFDTKSDGTGDPGLTVNSQGSGALQGYVRNPNWAGTFATTGPTQLVAGQWTYVVYFVQRGSPDFSSVYVNGADATGPSALALSNENLSAVDGLSLGVAIGDPDANCGNFAFAHVAVYLKTLTPTQIATHFAAGHA